MDCWAPTANGAAAEPAPTDPESTTGPVATKARRKSVTIVADPESYDGGDEEAPAPRITTQRAFLHPSLRHVKFKNYDLELMTPLVSIWLPPSVMSHEKARANLATNQRRYVIDVMQIIRPAPLPPLIY